MFAQKQFKKEAQNSKKQIKKKKFPPKNKKHSFYFRVDAIIPTHREYEFYCCHRKWKGLMIR